MAAVTGVVLAAHLALPPALDAVVRPHVFRGIAHAVPASNVVSRVVILTSALGYLSTAWLWAAFVDRSRRWQSWAGVLAAWATFWAATVSLCLTWTYSPAAHDYVLRPYAAELEAFETALIWGGITVGGTAVILVRTIVADRRTPTGRPRVQSS